MKLLPVSADLAIYLLIGPTKQKASLTFHQKVSGTCVLVFLVCVFVCTHRSTCESLCRVRIPVVPRREFCSGPDRCLHPRGRQTVPVCLQPHHQRQTCECVGLLCRSCLTGTIFGSNLVSSWITLVLQVQIRPWNLNDSDFVMDGSQPLDPRKTIFVGGVPRPLRAGIQQDFVVSLYFLFTFTDVFNSCFSWACHDHGPSVWGGLLRRDRYGPWTQVSKRRRESCLL